MTRNECECPDCTTDTGGPWAYCDACAPYDCRGRCWARYWAERKALAELAPAIDWDEPEYWRE
jgi:hypothetical protein